MWRWKHIIILGSSLPSVSWGQFISITDQGMSEELHTLWMFLESQVGCVEDTGKKKTKSKNSACCYSFHRWCTAQYENELDDFDFAIET